MTDTSLIIFFIALFWLVSAALAFVSGALQGRPRVRWAWISLISGPFGLVLALFPHGEPENKHSQRSRKEYADEDFFKSTPPLSYEVRQLKRTGRYDEAAEMLEILVDEVERRASRSMRPMPAWYHQQLASVYKALGKTQQEIKILHRFLRGEVADNAAVRKMQARLSRLEKERS